mgnify:FL=1
MPTCSRGNVMSRFHPFEIYGWRLQLRPIGWRGLPLLQRLPNFTGDEIICRVKARRTGDISQEDDLQHVTFHVRTVSDLSEITATTGGEFGQLRGGRVSFGRFSFSGEYWIEISYARKDPAMGWSPQRGVAVAVIQVRMDYLILMPILSLITVTLGVVGTLLVQWLS